MITQEQLLSLITSVTEIYTNDKEYDLKTIEVEEERAFNSEANKTKVEIRMRMRMMGDCDVESNYRYTFPQDGDTTKDTKLVEQIHTKYADDDNIDIQWYENGQFGPDLNKIKYNIK